MNHSKHKAIRTGSDEKIKQRQDEFKGREMDKFWAMLYLRGADQSRFGSLLTEWRQAFANNRDLYPEDLNTVVDIMRVMPVKKTKCRMSKGTPKQEDVHWQRKSGWLRLGSHRVFAAETPTT